MKDLIVSGYNGGAWNGPRIYSSFAAANPQTGIGYAEASDVLPISGTQTATFCGTTVDGTSTLARYTLLGDATLDGQVGFADLVRLAQNYNGTDKFWPDGDFNYDGAVDFTDLVKLAQNYNQSVSAAPPVAGGMTPQFETDLARAFAVVPEPGASAAGAVLMAALARRRRREHQ
jgi:hypothetical protein